MGVGGVVVGQSRAKHTGLLLQVGVSPCRYIQRGLEDCHCIGWPSGGSQCGYRSG